MNTVNLFKKSYKILAIITAAALLLLFICFLFSFDADNGYLVNGVLSTAFFVVYIAGVILAMASMLIPSEFDILETPDSLNSSSKPFYVAGTLASLFIGAFSFSLVSSVADAQMLLLSGAGLISFGIYLLFILVNGYKYNVLKLVFLFGAIASPVAIGLGNSKNYTHHINSIENTLTVFFAISFLLYILYEAKRVVTGRHSGWHFTSMLLTLLTGLSLSGAYLMAYILGFVKEGHRFYQAMIIFAISLFMAFELNRFLSTLTPKSTYKRSTYFPTSNEESK